MGSAKGRSSGEAGAHEFQCSLHHCAIADWIFSQTALTCRRTREMVTVALSSSESLDGHRVSRRRSELTALCTRQSLPRHWAAKPPGENIRTCVYPDNVESVACGDVTSSPRFHDQCVPDPPGLADAGRRFPWPRIVQRHCEIPLGKLGFQIVAEWVRYCGLYMPCMLYRFGFPITVI